MCKSQHEQVAINFILLFPFFVYGFNCHIDFCNTEYQAALDRGIVPETSERYCELNIDTRRCLTEAELRCNGTDIRLRSFRSGLLRKYNDFNCDSFNISQYGQRKGCPSWPSTVTQQNHKVCTLFGYPHLRTFTETFFTCNSIGAYSLIDNPFFLIQITNSLVSVNNEAQIPAVTKITLLIKNQSGCTKQKIYEANRDEKNLPKTFDDGFVNNGGNETILIKADSENHVIIDLHYISTVIHFIRDGPYLGVSLKIPQRLYDMLYDDKPQLCLHGCGSQEYVQIHDALAHPYQYIEECTDFSSPLNRPELAELHCQQLGLFDDFYDFCVFDQLIGDTKLADLTKSAQDNYRQLQSISNYITGRSTLSIYHRRPKIKFKCNSKRMISSSSSISISIAMNIFVFIFNIFLCFHFYIFGT
jgi:hypothetical protein